MSSNQLDVYHELRRLSSIVASSYNFDLQGFDAVIGSCFVNCEPVEQLDKFNLVEETNIKVIWAQEHESIRAWADELHYCLMDRK
jgi:hypothetical protein